MIIKMEFVWCYGVKLCFCYLFNILFSVHVLFEFFTTGARQICATIGPIPSIGYSVLSLLQISLQTIINSK